jgi:hypothetical protein
MDGGIQVDCMSAHSAMNVRQSITHKSTSGNSNDDHDDQISRVKKKKKK